MQVSRTNSQVAIGMPCFQSYAHGSDPAMREGASANCFPIFRSGLATQVLSNNFRALYPLKWFASSVLRIVEFRRSSLIRME